MKTIVAFVALLAVATADTCTDCKVIGILRFSSQEEIIGHSDAFFNLLESLA